MYVTLKISHDVFNGIKAKMSTSKVGNYYETPAGARTIKIDADLPALVQQAAIEPQYPGEIRAGYTIKDDSAIYCTCAGNMYGVCKVADGQHLALYFGRRSRIRDLLSMLMCCGAQTDELEVVEYQTEGPQDMLWYEDRTQYTVRQDDITIASTIAGPDWDEDAAWCNNVMRCLNAVPERFARVQKMVSVQKR